MLHTRPDKILRLLVAFAVWFELSHAYTPYKLPWWHVRVDTYVRNRFSVNHTTKIDPLVNVFENGHDPCDGKSGYLFKTHSMGGHVNIDNYFPVSARPNPLSNITVGNAHPDVDKSYNVSKTPISSAHPSVQAIMSYILPSGHPNVDVLLRKPVVLPWWHPSLNILFTRRAAITFKAAVSGSHPDIKDAYLKKSNAPAAHPNITKTFAAVLPANHPNVDMLIKNITGNPLPDYHPDISNYVEYGAALKLPSLSIAPDHPDIDAAYKRGDLLPSGHPSVSKLFGSSLPDAHPDLDTLFAAPASNPLPDWHQSLEAMVSRRTYLSPGVILSIWVTSLLIAATFMRFLNKALSARRRRQQEELLAAQKKLDHEQDPLKSKRIASAFAMPAAAAAKLKGPSAPPNAKAAPELPPRSPMAPQLAWRPQQEAASAVPLDTHEEETGTALPVEESKEGQGNQLPPKWTQYVSDTGVPYYCNEETGVSQWEKPVAPRPALPARPAGFAATRDQIASSNSGFAATRDQLVSAASSPSSSASLTKPSGFNSTRDHLLREKEMGRVPSIDVHEDPEEPGAADELLPNWVEYKTEAGDPYYYNTVTLVTQWERPVKPKRPPLPPRDTYGLRSWNNRHKPQWGPAIPNVPLPPRDRMLHLSQVQHAQHRGPSFYDESDVAASRADAAHMALEQPGAPEVPAIKKRGSVQKAHRKRNTGLKACWRRTTQTRIAKTQWTTGNVLFLAIYCILNYISILLSPAYTLDRGFGSLAVANAMFLIIPATRNNVLTWLLGLPFDHVVLYHRFLGRFTICLSTVHFGLYLSSWTSSFTYLTGLFAVLCGYVIGLTTIDWVRRKQFTIFFWSHYAFIGFYVLAFLHHRFARPFLIVGMVLYGLDRLLRILWMWVPRHAIMFRNRGENIAQVRFKKNPLTELLGMHKVGQYYFVNFPHLSLTEWHPFSVSSGPREPFVELHIRALGDHTRDIVAFSKECVAKNTLPWIRIDGPYGVHDFNYRRYESLLLVGGGVGVTPVLGIVKDIYLRATSPKHSMELVNVVWVMPDGKEAETFLDVFKECMRISNERQDVPPLVVQIYCTRAKPGSVAEPMVAGRPNFVSILNDATRNRASTLVFACGPEAMVNQLWDESNQRNCKSNRVDFHHETFEF